jgi:hypothetical protein
MVKIRAADQSKLVLKWYRYLIITHKRERYVNNSGGKIGTHRIRKVMQ